MLIKLLIIALLLFIVINLFRALYVLLKNEPNRPVMSVFLGRRVLYSAVILLIALIGLGLGLLNANPRPY